MQTKSKEEKQKVTLYLPPELHRQLKIKAAVDAETMTDIAQRAIVFYLSNPEVIEQQELYGRTHRVYSCPDCSSQLSVRDGEIVSIHQQLSAVLEDHLEEHLSVEKAVQVGSVDIDSQGEEELVTV